MPLANPFGLIAMKRAMARQIVSKIIPIQNSIDVLLYVFCVSVYRNFSEKEILLHFESVICDLIHRNLGFDQEVSTQDIFLCLDGSVGGSPVGEEFDDFLINQQMQFAGFSIFQCDTG